MININPMTIIILEVTIGAKKKCLDQALLLSFYKTV